MNLPLRFILYSGILSDLEWLSSMGFDEAGPVCNIEDVPMMATTIHRAGITYAAVNPFCDVSDAPGEAGAPLAPAFQALKSAHWDIVAGAGMSGDIVRVAMNYMHFCSYGPTRSNVYSSPYNHPTAGPNTYHVDYISTFDQDAWWLPCLNAQANAFHAGSAEVGIAISLQMFSKFDLETWIAVVTEARSMGIPCNNVCFCGDVATDGAAILKTDAYEILTGLINKYGIRHGIEGI